MLVSQSASGLYRSFTSKVKRLEIGFYVRWYTWAGKKWNATVGQKNCLFYLTIYEVAYEISICICLLVRHRLRLLTHHTKKEREVTIVNRRKYNAKEKPLEYVSSLSQASLYSLAQIAPSHARPFAEKND